jgi:23S rRNA (uridine2552-2'-O)-methyltransferase
MINKFKQLISRTIRDESSFRFINRSKSMNSSNIWLERQRKDPYVRRAIRESYRARSAFKLIEIDQKYKFLRTGDLVIDIGSTPGN